MALCKSTKSHLVYQVTYDYDDLELNQHFRFLNYFEKYDDVCCYLIDIGKENDMLDNAFYRCRQNIKIKISLKYITDKLYVSLFKVPNYDL